jgi:hypothetical protein
MSLGRVFPGETAPLFQILWKKLAVSFFFLYNKSEYLEVFVEIWFFILSGIYRHPKERARTV